MAKQKLPIEVIKARGRKHLTKSEIAEREAGQIKANFDKIVLILFLTVPSDKNNASEISLLFNP